MRLCREKRYEKFVLTMPGICSKIEDFSQSTELFALDARDNVSVSSSRASFSSLATSSDMVEAA